MMAQVGALDTIRSLFEAGQQRRVFQDRVPVTQRPFEAVVDMLVLVAGGLIAFK
jgi:hypothetical protein